MNNMLKSEDNMRHFQYPQRIEFNAQEDQHSVELLSNDVTIVPSPGGHNHGSSKVKLKNIVDFTWEHHFYTGQLLAVHMSGKYLAYGIKVGTGGGVVRVVNKELELRALLRGMHGAIQDLAFAHVSNAILACVDCSGSLFVHTIEVAPSELLCSLVLRVDAKDEAPLTHRVIWCPYIPEDDPSDGDEVSKLLVLTRGSKAELWSVATVASKFRSIEANDPVVRESGGMLEIDQHSGMIVEAAFSPDGTALATASLDGEVKFFQVYMQNSGTQPQPRCLHQWKPHGGRPISCLFFLDDHKNYQPDVQFWRFAVTGCDQNSELKVWSCELWTCLQTIKFTATPTTGKLPVLKAGLDLSASYLLLSDIYNKVLYILSISKDSGEAVACVSTVSEFLLPYPILSFGIVDAGQRKIRPTGGSLEDLCPCDEETEDQLVIRMYLVQPKSLQECHIAFKPASQIGGNCLMDTLTHDSLDYSEDLPDMTVVNHNSITVENGEEDRSLSATIEAATNHTTGLNLMTPDAFSSPAKKENSEDNNSAGGSFELAKTNASPSLAQVVQALSAVETTNGNELEEQTPASGGSSPSREVREILSLTKTNEDDVENESDKTLEITKPVVKEEWLDFPMAMLKDMSVHAMQQQPQKSEDFSNGSPSIVQRKIPTKEEMSVKENENAWQLINERYIQDLNSKIESMLEIIQDQRQELRDLRAEVTRLRQETPISARIEPVLKAAQQQNANLEQSLYGQMTRQREFINLIDLTIKEKMENTLPRVVEAALDPLKHQLRLDTVRMDEVFKENLTQLINSAQVKDTLSKAAASAAKPALDTAFKETFTTVFLPGMEKTCQNMFRQVQDAFVRGTREYLKNVEAITENQYQQRNHQQNDNLTILIREELQTEFTRGITNLQKCTLRTVRDSIRDNLSQQFTEFSDARSRATTPAIPTSTMADTQSTILSLLQRGKLNSAFQQALSASDLSLVVLVCEKTEPSRVLSCPHPSGQGTRCILQQSVILSLVQQLSADLGHRTELKHRWLEEAILSLDPNDPITREHMGNVLISLQNQLVTFIEANPNHQSIRHMKMLAMATRALLSQHP